MTRMPGVVGALQGHATMKASTLGSAVLFFATCSWSAGAAAQSATQQTSADGAADAFGGARQIAVSSDVALTIARATTNGVPGGTTTIDLAPALDYFALKNVSVGGFIGFKYATTGDNDANRFSMGPRVGYNLNLSDLVSLWPKIGFSYARTSTTTSAIVPDAGQTSTTTVQRTTTGSAVALNLFAPLLFHPAVHFFAGIGPFLDTDLSGDNRTTVWGAKMTLGGWL